MELLLAVFAAFLIVMGAMGPIIDSSMKLWPPRRRKRRCKPVLEDVARRRSIVYGNREVFFRDAA